MKKALYFLSILVLMSLACDLSVVVAPPTRPAPQPTSTMILATGVPTLIPASPEAFNPTLSQLDSLIQSMQITP